ncbi:glutamate receptor ionotropic, kainate 2-like isoform X2 [Anoplolepis gracilipes]|uniref:glutamate receptor ionotropic, kainate 2-like isoform X2 n=1 Tax=Anoplolepis gracilipes TaxID=354296 RepID=UPI003BA24043
MNDRKILLLYITTAFISHILGFPRKIPIGGIFDSDEMIQRAFEISIEAVNNKNITVAEDTMGVFLTLKSEKINKNAIRVAKRACKLVNRGVAGIFGPQNKLTANYVESMCDTLDIPHIAARWDSESKRGNVINLYPHPDMLSMVFHDIIKEYKWKEYAILYDNTDNLIRMSRLLKLPNMNSISAMAFHLGSGPNFRKAMKEVKGSDYRNIIIDCSTDILATILEQALQVGILSERYRVVITSLDLQTVSLEPYKYSGVNLTGVRLINPESPIVQRILQFRAFNWNLTNSSDLKVEAALAYDAVQLFARGYARLYDSVKGNIKKLFCNRTEIWGHGFSLSNYIRNEQINGLSGMIKFDTAGFRSEFHLDILNLEKQGLRKIGRWETNFGIKWEPGHRIPGVDDEKSLRDKHFLVLISLTDPYGMLKESSNMTIGNDRYEGFAIDIIHEMSKILGFNYTFEVQVDNAYGSLNKTTGQWNGMIGKIIAGTADLAITDLTVTAERQDAVDFTSLFMNLGISVLYRKPTSAPPNLLSFLGPFSKDVWVYLIAAYIIVTMLLFVIGKLCPVEWTNPYPCIKEPEVLETPFTLLDTPFCVIGALLKGNTGFAPAGISTRTLAIAWWFFNLIIGSTYVANLAAALATKSAAWPFKVAEDLAYQHEIKYGAKKGGSTLSFFKDSSHEPYQIMYNYMMDHADEVLMGKNEDGVWKVQQENYAYLMESSSIEYIQQRKCNVTQVGGLLDAKGYGIAMKKDIYYRTDLSGAVLKLKENGIINELQHKWWREKRGGDECEEKVKVQVEALNFEDVKGVFLIMTSGVMLSWLFAGWSFLWNIRNLAIQHNVFYRDQIIEELKFLAKCNSKKIIKRRKTSLETIKSNSTDS